MCLSAGDIKSKLVGALSVDYSGTPDTRNASKIFPESSL
jgi:hypothetical protein